MKTSAHNTDRDDSRRALALLLLFTLGVRCGVLFAVPGGLVEDPDGYRRLAENLVEHGTFGEETRPTAYRPPLYPLVLAPWVALGETGSRWGIGFLHVVLGVATVAATWFLARRCRLGRWTWLPGALVACDPILLGQSTLVMTETLAAALVAIALLCLVRLVERPSVARALTAGAVLGACGLCRPEFLLWAVFCVPAIWLLLRSGGAAGSLSSVRSGVLIVSDEGGTAGQASSGTRAVVGWFIVAAVVVVLPWATRNQIQFGRPIVTTTHGGYTLLLANNGAFYDYLREGDWGAVWDARELGPEWGGHAHHESPADELDSDRRAYREAWANIRRAPGAFAYSCLVRAGRLWAFAPHQGSRMARLAVGAWYLAEFVLALVGLCVGLRGRFASGLWLFGGLLAASMTAVHTVYWSNMRMRGPLMIMVAIAASAAIARWGERRGKS
jgi:hypothetical protein